MTLLDALILAVVQGLTEFLPVSSSGHLVLAGALLGVADPEANFLYVMLLHLASAAAIAVAYWRDWLNLLRPEGRVLWGPIVIGTIPAALLGVLLQSRIQALFADPRFAAVGLLGTAAVLTAAEWRSRRAPGTLSAETMGLRRALAVGSAQAVAMLPGLSRSGSCLGTGLMLGLDREQAVRFTFLLGFPIICGAGAKTLLDALRAPAGHAIALDPLAATLGCLVCAVLSFATILTLRVVVRRRALWAFACYCTAVGGAALVWLAVAAPPVGR